jgi:hypothetical protein
MRRIVSALEISQTSNRGCFKGVQPLAITLVCRFRELAIMAIG